MSDYDYVTTPPLQLLITIVTNNCIQIITMIYTKIDTIYIIEVILFISKLYNFY